MSKGRPGTKKEESPGLSVEEIIEIKQAFDLFGSNHAGKLNPRELKLSMKLLGFDRKNLTILLLTADLDTPDIEKNRRISLMDSINARNHKLEDKESKEGTHRINDLFIDKSNEVTISQSSFKN